MADKMAQYNEGFCRGLKVAHKIAKEGGIEAIEKEILYRGRIGNQMPVSNADLMRAAEKIEKNIMQTVTALMLLTLHDEFGFGRKRLEQCLDRFMFKTECMGDPENLFCWQDVHDILQEECGMDMEINILEEDNRRRKETVK